MVNVEIERMSIPRWAYFGAAALAVLIVLFWDAIGNLWYRWGEQQELSHSYFIPIISAWLVWTNRDAIAKSVGDPSIVGPALLIVAGLFLLLGQVTHVFLMQHLALVITVAGLVAGFGGLSLLRATAAPVGFLLFAVPPPYMIIGILSWKFQEISSIIGVWMIQLMDIPVYLSGNVIDLGDYKLQVAEACSGLRYLFPFLSIGIMAAYLYRGPLWSKAVIVIATIPITIFMNSFRVAVTGALVQAYGTQHAEGALHFFEGWVVFLLCLLALFGVVWVMSQFIKPKMPVLDRIGAPELQPVPPSKNKLKLPVIGASLVGLLVAVLAVGQIVKTDALIIPERQSFASLPSEFEGRRTEIRPIDKEIAEVLGADDSIVVNVYEPDGDIFNFYAAYLEAQRDGRSWHSPRSCIPGGGWQIVEHDVLNRKTADGQNMAYNRLVIQFRDQRQLVYYWYDQRGRKIAREMEMKAWLLFDAVTKKRSDGAMVRLITPILDKQGIDAADEKLQSVMTEVEGFLPEYVPN